MKTLAQYRRKPELVFSKLPSDVVKEVKAFTAKVEKNLFELFQCAAFRQQIAEKIGGKEVKAKKARVKIARKKRAAAA